MTERINDSRNANFRADGANNDVNRFRVMPRNANSIYPEDREVRGFASKPNEVMPAKIQTNFPPRLVETDRRIVATLPKEGEVWRAPGK